MKILVDFDGVLIDMLKSLKVCLAKRGISFIPENVETYAFDGDIGCSKEVVYDCLKSKPLFSNLYWYDGAVTSLFRLKEKHDVWAYTCANENVAGLRQSVIDMLGLEGECYVGFDKPYIGDADVLIEDDPNRCQTWLDNGTGALIILVDQPYNRNFDDDSVVRVKNIKEAVKYIENMVDKA